MVAVVDSMVGNYPTGDILVILGSFNARTDCDRAGCKSDLSPHNFGGQNSNSQFDFAKSKGLRVGGSRVQS